MKLLEEEGLKILEGIRDVELDPTQVDQIWELHALEITAPQRAVVIEQLRRNRELINSISKERKEKRGATKKTDANPGLSLDDLDLDLEGL